jgi:DNA-binding winged helix-turn-helix (wHTH) protein
VLYTFDDVELDDRLYQLRRKGSVLHVEPRVFDLLLYLVRNRERVATKEDLLAAVWQGVAVSDSVLSTAMNGVRRAIGAKGRGAGPIETVYGRGYRLRADVAERAELEPSEPVAAPKSDDTFVGRDAVLATLHGALDGALAGNGSVVLLCGEAGIGKTRTAEEVAREAASRGALVAAARCPETTAAPAFWPWTQVLRALLSGDANSEVPSEVSVLVPEIHGEAVSDPQRFRLFDAVTSQLLGAAKRRPLLVWIDDLQWADAATLQLATWAARELRGAALLFVATVRIAPDASPALGAALAELARLDHATRIDLAGLGPADVARYLEMTVGTAPEDAVQALLTRTDGNPFFLRELVRLGSSEGTAADRLAAWTDSVPAGAREVMRRRIAALSEQTRTVLALAAVIGREFSLPLLAEAASLPREALLAALDEASAARVLADVPGALARQRFTHALVRDAIYEELPPGERAGLHERAARALEQLAPDRGEPLWAELAHHFHAAALRGCAAKAVRYAVLAARHAHARSAYEEAAAQYERAIAARELMADGGLRGSEGAPERPLDLLLALGDAQLRAGDIAQTQAVFARAADLARANGETEAFVRATLGFAGSALWGNRPDASTRGLLEEAQSLLGEGDPALRAQLLSRLAVIRGYSGPPLEEDERSAKAVALARASGSRETISEALHARHYVLQGADHLDERAGLASEILAIQRELGQSDRSFAIREAHASDCLMLGDRDGFQDAVDDALRTARESHHPAFLWLAHGAAASVALLDGRLAEAERAIAECASWAVARAIPARSRSGSVTRSRCAAIRDGSPNCGRSSTVSARASTGSARIRASCAPWCMRSSATSRPRARSSSRSPSATSAICRSARIG